MTPLEKALDALQRVHLANNSTKDYAKLDMQEIVEILGDLYWETLDQCPHTEE